MEPAQAARALFDSASRSFAVRLWDGTVLPPRGGAAAAGAVVLRRPDVLGLLLPPVSERRLAEAYLDEDLEIEGDAIAVLEAAARWEGPRPTLALAPAAVTALVEGLVSRHRAEEFLARAWQRTHSLARDRAAVRHHYDVSDDFYRLFLDADMVYSCAYFPTGRESLEEAQRAKLDLVCRKLRLAPGERFLDVGCGWGALLAHATKHYGVSGVGITLSQNQLATARRTLGAGGTGARAEALAADYRTLPEGQRFDKVASVGMMEHVGRDRLDDYFAAVYRHLAPGGLFLNHAIADVSGTNTIPWTSRHGGGFIARYIFPDGDLVPLAVVAASAERAGFEIRDVDSLREHYAETLAHWLARLDGRFAEAVALVGARRARAYRLYLASSAVAFRLGRISVYQMLLARRTPDGRARGVPRTRAEWYHA